MGQSDKDIKAWDDRLKEQYRRGWDNYIRRRVHLDTARVLEKWSTAGEFIYVEEASSPSAAAAIRLGRNTNDPIDLDVGTVIKTVFCECYITNTAQAGEWIDLIIGINFEYYKQTNADAALAVQQVLNLTHANPDTNVAAAANVCARALIKADVQNAGIAWIDFGAAAVQDSCIPLDPGEWIRVAIANTDQINANFEIGGEVVFIAYEV